MRSVSLILCVAFFLTACGNKNRVPGNVMPPDKMEAVLWDMMRADQFLTEYVLNKDTSKKKDVESIRMYQQIFGFHKITKEEFDKSFAYYRNNPVRLRILMDSIQNRKSTVPPPVMVDHPDSTKKPIVLPQVAAADTTPKAKPPIKAIKPD